MRRILAFILILPMLLCACTPAPADHPTTPSHTQQTDSVLPTETQNSAAESTASKPIPESTMTSDTWLIEKPAYLTYDAYFAASRDISALTNRWIKGDQVFSVKQAEPAWAVYCKGTDDIYVVPNSAAYEDYNLLGADGRYGYLYLGGTLVRMDLTTGEVERLLHYPICKSAYFAIYDNLVLYYAVHVNDNLEIGRIYLPELKCDTLYKMQGEFYNIAFDRVDSTTQPLSWSMYNPDFVELLKTELANPNSQYQRIPTKGLTGSAVYDYSAYWNDEDGLSKLLTQPILLHYIQDTSGVRALLRCTYDPVNDSLTKHTGIMDDCWHGSDYPHDHFNPDVTTAPAPQVLMGQWQNLVEMPTFSLQPSDSATKSADCILLTGVDSGKYVYVKTDGDYQKLTDTAVGWMQDTGSCVLYTSADHKTLFATTYDGSQSAKLYQATRGQINVDSVCMENDRLVIRDGDTLVEMSLSKGQFRELVRHENLQLHYIDSGEKLIVNGEYMLDFGDVSLDCVLDSVQLP